MDASGQEVRRLTTSPAHDAAADWTGDGEWIVFGRTASDRTTGTCGRFARTASARCS